MTEKYLYQYKNITTTEILVDLEKEKVKIKNLTNDLLLTAFGENQNPTLDDFEELLESRCFPKDRDYRKWHLEELGLSFYDPYAIVS